MSEYHIPVMLSEAIDLLNIKKGNWYVDCNLGGGGHTKEILKRGGKVVGIDLDADAIEQVSVFKEQSSDLILVQDNFSNLKKILEELSLKEVSGILFDLGVSSHQLENKERGFSFNLDAPLDMRMDQTKGLTAADLINGLHEKELADLFFKLGEEHSSRAIARRIVEVRKLGRIISTDQLAGIILSARKRSNSDRTHPATRVFQALRIAVNDELNSLKEALPQAFEVLRPGGRIAVISFHSLEDRIVKNFFALLEKDGKAKILTRKPLTPGREEVNFNPRSRSGKLRALEKV